MDPSPIHPSRLLVRMFYVNLHEQRILCALFLSQPLVGDAPPPSGGCVSLWGTVR
jgi:hypothetical protein